MASKRAETTLAVLEKVRQDVVTVGRLNKAALRAAFGPNVSEFQFSMAFTAARRAMEAEGYFIKPDQKERGTYIVATAEDVSEKALNKSRLAIVNKARQRMELISNAQRHHAMDGDSRDRLKTEELLYGRTLNFIERALLKSQRKKPEGLEE